jgi:hypothetical protein
MGRPSGTTPPSICGRVAATGQGSSMNDPKDRGLARHPMFATWPQEMRTTVTFDDLGDGATRVNIPWHPQLA